MHAPTAFVCPQPAESWQLVEAAIGIELNTDTDLSTSNPSCSQEQTSGIASELLQHLIRVCVRLGRFSCHGALCA